jgi:hypothetical protein
MMPEIQVMLAKVSKSRGLDYVDFLKGLQNNKQRHVEVY